jgi:propanol-preferring alcohol dehydrogenase
MKEALAFAADGKVKANVETARLEDINEVLERLREGKVTGRIVLNIS